MILRENISQVKITPNQLTILRIILAFVSFYLLVNNSLISNIAAFIVFTAAALTDLWDGWLARTGGMVSNFGKILDPIADKILIVGVMFIFSYLGIYPFWVLIPIVVRELLVTGLRLFLLSKSLVIAAEKSGKIKVVSQIISLFFSFLCLLNRDYAHVYLSDWPLWIDQLSVFANYFFLIIATWFSLVSGWDFLRHNWRQIYA